jgi:hypothetical protein
LLHVIYSRGLSESARRALFVLINGSDEYRKGTQRKYNQIPMNHGSYEYMSMKAFSLS